MNPMLQRHCARYIYVIPDGLRELMSDISREVLRSQPDDIYTFIADYLDALLITRENARVSAKFVQYILDAADTIVDLLTRSRMDMREANHAAEVIQEAFKAWSNKKGILKEDETEIVIKIIEEAGITEIQAQEAAVCIQHAFKAFKTRQQREQELLSGVIDWRVAARSAIKLYRKTGVSPEEAKKAANLIKAAYKGYYTRRALRHLNQVNAEVASEESYTRVEGEDSESFVSGYSEKKKGVRIDYHTVVPHVDFGGEELIDKDLVPSEDDTKAMADKDLEGLEDDEDVMEKIFGGERMAVTSESFIKILMDECVRSATRPKKTAQISKKPEDQEVTGVEEEVIKTDEDEILEEIKEEGEAPTETEVVVDETGAVVEETEATIEETEVQVEAAEQEESAAGAPSEVSEIPAEEPSETTDTAGEIPEGAEVPTETTIEETEEEEVPMETIEAPEEIPPEATETTVEEPTETADHE